MEAAVAEGAAVLDESLRGAHSLVRLLRDAIKGCLVAREWCTSLRDGGMARWVALQLLRVRLLVGWLLLAVMVSLFMAWRCST